jgi:RNA polymerase sigma-70 factor, ECF subfamily
LGRRHAEIAAGLGSSARGAEQSGPFERLIEKPTSMPPDRDFENLALKHYRDLYRFAFSLTRSESDASDLTQQTFYLWATKGSQMRNAANVKSWLFTTLHREFLQAHRRQTRFPEHTLEEASEELPQLTPELVNRIDAQTLLEHLGRMEEHLRAPLALYYLEDLQYREIAEVLEIPLGTVQSRISRGKAHLCRLLTGPSVAPETGKEERRG